MNSKKPSAFTFEPTLETATNLEAMAPLNSSSRLSDEVFLWFLKALPQPTVDELRKRKGPCGEPFVLK